MRESIGTEFYYIGVTDNKKKQTSLPANYISVWVIFLPSHLICFGPHWVFCFMRIRLPLSFYSISRIQEERKKWWLGRNLTKIIRITLVARGTFGMGWGWLWVRRTCYSSTSSLVAGSFFFAASDSFFSLVRHSKWMLRDTWALVWVRNGQTFQSNWRWAECVTLSFFGSFSPLWVSVSRWNYVVRPPFPTD